MEVNVELEILDKYAPADNTNIKCLHYEFDVWRQFKDIGSKKVVQAVNFYITRDRLQANNIIIQTTYNEKDMLYEINHLNRIDI